MSCLDPASNLQLFSLKYIEDYWKLSCLVATLVQTANTDKTRQLYRCKRFAGPSVVLGLCIHSLGAGQLRLSTPKLELKVDINVSSLYCSWICTVQVVWIADQLTASYNNVLASGQWIWLLIRSTSTCRANGQTQYFFVRSSRQISRFYCWLWSCRQWICSRLLQVSVALGYCTSIVLLSKMGSK